MREQTTNPYTQLTTLSTNIDDELDQITRIVREQDSPMLNGVTQTVREMKLLLSQLRSIAMMRRA